MHVHDRGHDSVDLTIGVRRTFRGPYIPPHRAYHRIMITDDDIAIETASAYVRGLARTCGFRPDAHPSALALAEGLLGPSCVERAVIRDESTVASIGGRWRLYLRAALPLARQHWALALATARWAIRNDAADVCENAVAAAILLPAATTTRALSTRDPADVARVFVAPIVATTLRAGELTSRPVAHVVDGAYARIRGDRGRVLPRDRAALHAIASGTVRALRTHRITSPSERGVLLIAA